ncbi:MAG: aminotransferase class I/II-fold pyridoxal phosphate-dependent enzyme [Nanoarchaeota archaeon]|nr:aminotransferase class I/II-fold pyridoxal phosphate-dependent enzyme [Nanoarchaeota archaeon]MBU1644334.1 aminotransferase class I/II-fold pyridoxal phosphate-dependent enzyme [Nanoarchaeota archaeon]MBU1976343.1 aminotransferase class I/II-fold pyridoxal phosphate-dependent enzyme [Nanoarchaeota archaeon]
MIKEEIIKKLKHLTRHDFIEITTRGNTAIESALSILPKGKKVLIPEEGGWLTYQDLPKKLGLELEEVRCADAKIDLQDLAKKIEKGSAFLYQNPGGYFAEQPLKDIYQVCKEKESLVLLDASGSIGTKLCEGRFADIIIGSFGKWKLVEAHTGGFVSCNDKNLFDKIKKNIVPLEDQEKLNLILKKLNELDERIKFLTKKRKEILEDLKEFDLVHKEDLAFVVVVKFSTVEEKEKIINYCNKKELEWTECPRYIRLNKPAISIEVKRLLK